MAKDSDLNLYNKTIYQIFPRQYSSTHDFKGVEKDLQRIKRRRNSRITQNTN